MTVLMMLLIYSVGVMVGLLITHLNNRGRLSGRFLIDTTDPTKDIFRIELYDSKIDSIPKRKYILLRTESKTDMNKDVGIRLRS